MTVKKDERLKGNTQILQLRKRKGHLRPARPPPDYKKVCFSTPETFKKSENIQALQTKILELSAELQQKSLLDSQTKEADKDSFLKKCDSSRSALNEDQIKHMGNLFTEHRFDVGYNTQTKLKLTI